MKKVGKIAAGVGLVVIGLIGLLLPVMPGWAFIIPGLMLLAEYFPSVRRLLDWAKSKLESVRTPTGGMPESCPVESVDVKATASQADPQTGPIRDR